MSQRLDHQAFAPDGMRALGGVYQYVAAKTGLPRDLLNLVYLRASQVNGCAYCISAHARNLLQAGVPQSKLTMLTAWRDTPDLYDPKERAALAWTETVTLVAATTVPDSEFEAASAHFEPKELVDLTLAIGLINAYNRMATGFRRTPEHLAGG